MSKTLFSDLKRIGIDEELAARISASLDPKYNASKSDVLVLQETILQVQMKTDDRYNTMQQAMMKLEQKTDERYSNLHKEMHEGFTKVRTEMGTMHRQFWLTYFGLIITIISIFLLNVYFH